MNEKEEAIVNDIAEKFFQAKQDNNIEEIRKQKNKLCDILYAIYKHKIERVATGKNGKKELEKNNDLCTTFTDTFIYCTGINSLDEEFSHIWNKTFNRKTNDPYRKNKIEENSTSLESILTNKKDDDGENNQKKHQKNKQQPLGTYTDDNPIYSFVELMTECIQTSYSRHVESTKKYYYPKLFYTETIAGLVESNACEYDSIESIETDIIRQMKIDFLNTFKVKDCLTLKDVYYTECKNLCEFRETDDKSASCMHELNKRYVLYFEVFDKFL